MQRLFCVNSLNLASLLLVLQLLVLGSKDDFLELRLFYYLKMLLLFLRAQFVKTRFLLFHEFSESSITCLVRRPKWG